MLLRTVVGVLTRYDHRLHHAILGLVALSVAALAIERYVPGMGGPLHTWIDHVIHWLHMGGLSLAVVLLAVRLVLRRSPNRWARFVSQENIALLKDWLKDPVGQRAPNFAAPPGSFEFVDAPDSPLVPIQYHLNRSGFERSDFEVSDEEIRTRNGRWLTRNPRLFMLVRDPYLPPRKAGQAPREDAYIGYCAIVPLNEAGHAVYTAGKIRDRDLAAELIAAPGEKIYSLVIFAMMLREPYCRSTNLAPSVYLYHLLICLIQHVRLLRAQHPAADGPLEVWAQAEHERIRRLLEILGFTDTHKKSADGFAFYSRTIPAQPQRDSRVAVSDRTVVKAAPSA